MPDIERFENLVIGNGTAGKYLAWSRAKASHRTAIVERKYLGGACPNIACLPTYTRLQTALIAKGA
jgi:pyruvate/2-oxoglutarate dehydrogenase complex dihydrolipoamide dehydrogenase (E3) component